ncbi:calmodulin-binding transcription activator 2-like [Prosopis cineraria]|uniref:calmodulin-binding transcription activator 2-like n=1 Tax=Prosopis cineraria TaxID=364024 RepID=UPI00240E9FA2|nr:calmodulin-binding transcription activator 2-like [Prosopis cineraria]
MTPNLEIKKETSVVDLEKAAVHDDYKDEIAPNPVAVDPRPGLDFEQLRYEAQHRWLRPSEICEILRNYRMFAITSEPPNRPPSGSLFLFDRRVLIIFRRDGHNWRKKSDGKTVKEAHERVKVGSTDDELYCYYAHGEENEKFQRRSCWMLEKDIMSIVLVQYLEVKGIKQKLRSPSPSRGTYAMSSTSTLSSLHDVDSEDS